MWKINKIVATRCHILRLKCTKFNFGWGSAPDPAGGAYSAPPDPLAEFKGPTSKGREGRGGVGREREGRGRGRTPSFLLTPPDIKSWIKPRTVRLSPPTNRHQTFYMPDVLPVAISVKAPKGNLRHLTVTSIFYLRLGGYAFIGVCLFVSRILEKPLDRLSQNSVERRHRATEETVTFWW